MRGLAFVEELSGQGVELWAGGDKLRCRGPRRVMTAETVARLEEHKTAILEALEAREKPKGQNVHSDPVIETTTEVVELARARLGELAPEYQTDAPYPPPEPGHDPLVQLHTDKARFFQGVRRRDQERRKSEGLPPWIRLVDGGGDAA